MFLTSFSNASFALTVLPVDGVVEVDADRVDVHSDNEEEVDAHAKIGNGQVDHQKLGDGHRMEPRRLHKDHDHKQIADDGSARDEPGGHSQPSGA